MLVEQGLDALQEELRVLPFHSFDVGALSLARLIPLVARQVGVIQLLVIRNHLSSSPAS